MHFKLTEEIIDLSTAKNWELAKREWSFDLAYYSDELLTCLCGHYPIKNICVIVNVTNKMSTEVGNCCIKKFLGIDDGDKIFTSIKKLKEDITKSMSAEVIDYVYKKNGISDFEHTFYIDTYRKRNLSVKQLDVKKRINEKFLKFTSYETNSQFSKINLILSWAQNNPNFDTDFVLSIRKSCEKNGRLTEKQATAIDNIIKKFGIGK